MECGRVNLQREEILKLEQPQPTHHNFKSKVGVVFGQLTTMFYVGRNSNGVVMYMCECTCGNFTVVHGWDIIPEGRKVSSCGCYRTKLKKTISPSVLKSRINKAIENTDYKVIDVGTGGFDHIWTFLCAEHGEFKSTYGLVVHRGTKCPRCVTTGYKSNLPGFFYLNAVFDGDDFIAIKYGITNNPISYRLKQIEARSKFSLDNIVSLYFEDGQKARDVESSFSKQFGKKFLTKEYLPNGYTETIDPALLQEALDWLTKQIKY